MSRSLLITYDLIKTHKDYKDLEDAIRENFPTYWHHLGSVWIVKTEMSIDEAYDALKYHIDSNDRLLIVGLSGNGVWSGALDQKPGKTYGTAGAWLRENL